MENVHFFRYFYALNVLKNAKLFTLTKSSTENDRNLTTKVNATRWDDEKQGDAEVSREDLAWLRGFWAQEIRL